MLNGEEKRGGDGCECGVEVGGGVAGSMEAHI